MTSLLAALLALGVGASPPYVRTRVSDADPAAHCLRWLDGTITWQQNREGYDLTDTADEFAAIRRSYDRWQAVSSSCGNLALVEGPRSSDRHVGFRREGANTNLVLFRKRLCSEVVPRDNPCLTQRRGSCSNEFDCWDFARETIALTTVTFNPNNGVILDADIEYNASRPGGFTFTVSDGPRCLPGNQHQGCIATDLENTTTHEVGHFLGLDHTDFPGSTMNPTASLGETSKREVDPGSSSFVCEAYPRGRTSVPCRVDALPRTLGDAKGCAATGGGAGTLLGAAVALHALARRRGGAA